MGKLFDSYIEDNSESEKGLKYKNGLKWENILCIEKTGRLSDCNNCLLGKYKYCEIMVSQIRKYATNNLSGFDDEEKYDIAQDSIFGVMSEFNNYSYGEPSFFQEEFSDNSNISSLCKNIEQKVNLSIITLTSQKGTIEWLNEILLIPDILKNQIERDTKLKDNIKNLSEQIQELQNREAKLESKEKAIFIKKIKTLNRLILQNLFPENCPDYLNYEGNKGKKFNSFVKRILNNKKIDEIRIKKWYPKTPNYKLTEDGKEIDVRNKQSFIKEIKDLSSPAKKYVYEKLSPETKNLLNSIIKDKDTKTAITSIFKDFNRFLIDEQFYNHEYFEKLENEEMRIISQKTKKHEDEIKWLNRKVIDKLFTSLSNSWEKRKEIRIDADSSDDPTGTISEGVLPSSAPTPQEGMILEEEKGEQEKKWEGKLEKLLEKSGEEGFEFIKQLIEITKQKEEGKTDVEIAKQLGYARETVVRKRKKWLEKIKELKGEFYD